MKWRNSIEATLIWAGDREVVNTLRVGLTIVPVVVVNAVFLFLLCLLFQGKY